MNLSARGILAMVLLGGSLAATDANAQAVEALGVPNGTFTYPAGVAVDASGNVFVADFQYETITEILASGGYTTVKTLANSSSFFMPDGLAIDASGNLFVADQYGNLVKELLAPGYTTIKTLPAASSNFDGPGGIAVDASGNVFVSSVGNGSPSDGSPEKNTVKEILAAGGYVTVKNLGPAGPPFNVPGALALDHAGNVFVADVGDNAVKEILAPGYVTVQTLPVPSSILGSPTGLAFDASGNLIVVNYGGGVLRLLAASGYSTVDTLIPSNESFTGANGLALDRSGNLFVTSGVVTGTGTAGGNGIAEVHMAPSPLAAAILPGSRSIVFGSTATVFATVINSTSSDLQGCGVALTDADDVTLSFQTTDPSTNTLIGTLNQRVPIPAKGSQTFLLSFKTYPNQFSSAPALLPDFDCQNVPPALKTTGVDTVDLYFSETPTADIIALAATATNDGTVHLANGIGAFAVATVDAGTAATLTATTDTGAATLPLTTAICQTTPTGQCLAPAAASVSVSFAANVTPTFSIFSSTTGQIPFAPGTSRVFVRFKDGSGTSHGSTSVAITTN